RCAPRRGAGANQRIPREPEPRFAALLDVRGLCARGYPGDEAGNRDETMRKAWIFESDNGERMSLLENEFDGLLQMWGITLAEHKEGNDIPLKECTVLANKVEEMNGFTTYKRDGAKWSYHVDKHPMARLGV